MWTGMHTSHVGALGSWMGTYVLRWGSGFLDGGVQSTLGPGFMDWGIYVPCWSPRFMGRGSHVRCWGVLGSWPGTQTSHVGAPGLSLLWSLFSFLQMCAWDPCCPPRRAKLSSLLSPSGFTLAHSCLLLAVFRECASGQKVSFYVLGSLCVSLLLKYVKSINLLLGLRETCQQALRPLTVFSPETNW